MQDITIKINKVTLFTIAGLVVGLIGGYFWGSGSIGGVFAKNTNGANNQQVVVAGNNDQQGQPAAPSAKIEITADDHIKGGKKPQLYLVEYSDFQCPFCQSLSPTISRLMKEYGDKIAVVYRHYPLSFHQNAQVAAEASECAGEQGKFWEMHDVMFEKGQGDGTGLDRASLDGYAKTMGLNLTKFKSCMDTNKYAGRVSADFASGNTNGVQGTPATFVVDKNGNSELVSGAVPFENFKSIIDAKL